MKLELPYDIGGPLWWAETMCQGDGPVLAQVRYSPNAIKSVRVTEIGPLICTGDMEDSPGSQYACLSDADCRRWLAENEPGAVIMEPGKRVRAAYTDVAGVRSVVQVELSLDGIRKFVKSPVADEPDGHGLMAICTLHAAQAGDPITTYLTDAKGQVVKAMFGAFLLVQLTPPDAEGMRHITDISDDVTRWITPSEKPETAPCPFDPLFWTEFKGATVDDLCAWLKNKFRGDEPVHVCGTDTFYAHHAPGSRAVSLDCDALAELEEYEGREPALFHGTLGGLL